MTRDAAIARAEASFEDGAFRETLARRVAMPTESQNPERAETLLAYLEREMIPNLQALGFTTEIVEHPAARAPFLIAERIEDPSLPTVLGYGHGDVIRGLDADWDEGVSPWTMTDRGDRWYGRGVADNKGQHAINLAALQAVLETRGSLGFNAKYLIEMGEEVGSPGLRELCAENRGRLKADVLIASDGPRLSEARPTIFLGSRGGIAFDMWIDARQGGRHSGNWGGLVSNPAIQLSHAIASLVGPTGQIRIPEMVPQELPASVRRVLADCDIMQGPEGEEVEPWWGEPGLTPTERVFGWCSLEVLAYEAGNPRMPVNAIPPRAWARMQLRFVVGIDPFAVVPAIRRHLERQGLGNVKVRTRQGRALPCHAPRPGRSLGRLGGGLDRADDRRPAGDPAEPRRLAPQRCVFRHPRHAHDLGAALLSRLLAACAERAPAHAHREGGAGDHGRALLGSRGTASQGWLTQGGLGRTSLPPVRIDRDSSLAGTFVAMARPLPLSIDRDPIAG